ncbi:hypothetical protein DWV75_02250 [Ruminococcus sp. AF12-5]|nr:hypothetical protein DWV75_02250 [Ruminococcus sp. AF12-5]
MTRTDLEQHIKELEIERELVMAERARVAEIRYKALRKFSLSMKLDDALTTIRINGDLDLLDDKLSVLKRDLVATKKALQLMHRVPDFFYGEGDICMMEELTKKWIFKRI